MEQTATTTNESGKRPVFLTVLCILSFIAAGFAVVGYILAITAMGVVSAGASALEGMEGVTMTQTAGPSMGMTWAYIIVGFVTTLIALFGVIKMWKLKKMGFYLYVGATVASMVMGMIYSGFGAMGLIFPVAFIVMYGLNLKSMK